LRASEFAPIGFPAEAANAVEANAEQVVLNGVPFLDACGPSLNNLSIYWQQNREDGYLCERENKEQMREMCKLFIGVVDLSRT
jgi:hypothetical protein